MKKIKIMVALVLMLSLVACSAKSNIRDTTLATMETELVSSNDTAESAESQLLSELLATDTYLTLADTTYSHVVDYIRREPDEIAGGGSFWNLGEGYTLKLDHYTRTLTLTSQNGLWKRKLCFNVDFPNSLNDGIGMTVVNDYTFYEMLDSIEIWQLGNKLFSVDLPSSEIQIVGTTASETIIRSDSTIASIIYDGDFQYKEIASDCAGSIKMFDASVWYVNMNADLIHINLVSKDFEPVAENVTCLVSNHDGVYSLAWREKGSLDWHEPEFYVDSRTGQTIPWSEPPGM